MFTFCFQCLALAAQPNAAGLRVTLQLLHRDPPVGLSAASGLLDGFHPELRSGLPTHSEPQPLVESAGTALSKHPKSQRLAEAMGLGQLLLYELRTDALSVANLLVRFIGFVRLTVGSNPWLADAYLMS